jgi:hypothetical protein
VIPRVPADPVRRERRKRDLLLASGLAREQALGALEEIGARADMVARGVIKVRAWVSDPQVWVAGGALGSALALLALPRMRTFRLLRWGTLAAQVWKIARRLLAARRGAG